MKKTIIYYYADFTGLHKGTTLISIGLISQCGKTFYAEFIDYDRSQINEWLQQNVINKLKFSKAIHLENLCIENENDIEIKGETPFIKEKLTEWVSQFDAIEIWSDCLSYDWVLFCDIFGGAMKLPENIYYIPFDLSTHFKEIGVDPNINREVYAFGTAKSYEKHNALWDAKIIKLCHEKTASPKATLPIIPIRNILDYEIRSSWWASIISWAWLQNISATYFAWKTKTKYARYEMNKAIQNILSQQNIK